MVVVVGVVFFGGGGAGAQDGGIDCLGVSLNLDIHCKLTFNNLMANYFGY